MEMLVSSEMTFFTTKQQSEICPHLRTGSSAEDRGRIDTSSLFCVSIINYLVFLVWLEVSHYFVIIGVVVQHLLIADVTEHIL